MKKILLTCIAVVCSLVAVAEELLIEAESFSQRGGWVLDGSDGFALSHGTWHGHPCGGCYGRNQHSPGGHLLRICPYLQLDFTLDRCRGPRKVPPGFRRQIAESYIRTYR